MFIKHSFQWYAIFYVYFEVTHHIFGHRIWHVPWLFLRFRWRIKYLGKSLLFRSFVAVTLFVIFFLCFHIVFSLSDSCDFEVEKDNELLQENKVISEELDKRVLYLCFFMVTFLCFDLPLPFYVLLYPLLAAFSRLQL